MGDIFSILTKTPIGPDLIHDSDLRARILPLFAVARDLPEQRVLGQGTVLRLDPFGNCATAFHVFEDSFYLDGPGGREMRVRQDRGIVVTPEDMVHAARREMRNGFDNWAH